MLSLLPTQPLIGEFVGIHHSDAIGSLMILLSWSVIVDKSREQHQELFADIETLRGQTEQTIKQLAAVYKQQNMDTNDWAIAEIEHLMIIRA